MFAMNRFNSFNSFNSFGNMNYGQGGILSTMLKAVVLLFIVYLIVNWYFKKSKKLLSMSSGTIAHNGFPSAAKTWQAVTHTMSWTVNHGEDIAFPQGMSK